MVKASAITNLVMIVSYVAGGGPNVGRLIVSQCQTQVRVDVKQFTAIVDQSVREHMRTV